MIKLYRYYPSKRNDTHLWQIGTDNKLGYKYPQTAKQALWNPVMKIKYSPLKQMLSSNNIKTQNFGIKQYGNPWIKITQFTQEDIQQKELKSNKSTKTDLAAWHGRRSLFQFKSHFISTSSFRTKFIPIHISCYFSLSFRTFLSLTKWSYDVQFCNQRILVIWIEEISYL